MAVARLIRTPMRRPGQTISAVSKAGAWSNKERDAGLSGGARSLGGPQAGEYRGGRRPDAKFDGDALRGGSPWAVLKDALDCGA